jgi:uncharacterized protein (DUF1778 family)
MTTGRLTFRVSGEQEALIRHAAALEGVTITEFLARAARESAKRVAREHETITLRGAAAEQFARALLKPAAASPALANAAREYRDSVEERLGER